MKSVTIICICNVTLSKGNFQISSQNLVNFYCYYSYTLKTNKMVKVSEKNINEVAKCRITANSDYNPESANIIARHLLLSLSCHQLPLFRNGYIQRFSYNCTQYSRLNLRKTGFFDADSIGSLRSSITSSITSLGSYVIYSTRDSWHPPGCLSLLS